jgi:hypothetical protein
MRHFSFLGMQRAGNHAVIGWWLRHFEAWWFRNNIMGPNPKYRAAQEERSGDYHKRIRVDSWEALSPSDIHISPSSEPLIVIIRDPFNWWASWFRYRLVNLHVKFNKRTETIDWYLKHIEYAQKYPSCCINYNKWFVSSDYRRSVEREWNLEESDDGLDHVSSLGEGSSFDGMAYQGMARQMGVLTRYEHVMHLPDYVEPLRARPELADISREIFDLDPPEGIYDRTT